MDNKPVTLSVKDWLIRKLAVKMMIGEKTIDAIITHQFQSANDALATNKSVELSGFGKFLFNDAKAMKRMIKLDSQINVFTNMSNNMELSEQKRESSKNKLKNALILKEALTAKLNNEPQSDIRGMEEQFDSAFQD